MTKLSKKFTQCLILGLFFSQIQVKVKVKNIEGSDSSSVRQAEYSDFIGISVYGDLIHKRNLTIFFNFQLIWPYLAMPDQV